MNFINFIQYDQSEKSYEKAVNFAQLYLGKDHLMTKNLRKVLKSAKIQIKNSMLREFEKTATSNFKKLAKMMYEYDLESLKN